MRLDRSLRLYDGTDGVRVLVGGSPLRLLRLRPPADAIVEALQHGTSVEDALAKAPAEKQRAGERFVETLVQRGLAHPEPEANPGRSLVDLTIVIPAHNRAEALARLLVALGELTDRGARVIVVDDGSTDDTGGVATRHRAGVIRHEVARGPSAARNAGLAEVTTPFVAFLDSDVVPTPGWVDTCLSLLDENRADLVAPRIIGLVSKEPTAIERYEHIRSPLDLGPDPALIAPTTRVAYAPSAALVLRTEAIRSVNGFEETMHVGEDVDLLWRLHARGHVLRYEPLAIVAHDHRTQIGELLKRRFQYGTSAASLDQRHPGSVPPAVLSPWSALAWSLAVTGPVGLAAGGSVAALTAAQLPRKLPQLQAQDARLLAGRGHLAAISQLADASARTWFPLTALLSTRSKRVRLVLVASIVGQGLRDYRARKPAIGWATYIALRAADDAAYGFGVWAGSLRTRNIGALLPKLINWPGKKSPEQP